MKSYMRHIPFLIVLAIVSLVMTRGNDHGLFKDRPKAGVWTALSPSLPAPTEPMLMADGHHKILADFKGQVVLLNVWATWCPPCLKELPALDSLGARYKEKGLNVVTLSIDSLRMEQVQAFLDTKLQLKLQTLALDDAGKLMPYLNVKGLPVTYLIDREGNMTHRFIGASDWVGEDMLAPIDAALLH